MTFIAKITSREFYRFLITHVAGVLLHFSILYILHYRGAWNYIASIILAYLVVIIFGYGVQKYWTFKALSKPQIKEIGFYVAVYLVSVGVGMGFLYLALEVGDWKPWAAHIVGIMVSMLVHFVGLKWIVFRKKVVKEAKN